MRLPANAAAAKTSGEHRREGGELDEGSRRHRVVAGFVDGGDDGRIVDASRRRDELGVEVDVDRGDAGDLPTSPVTATLQ